jgi:murein DD-endopeptidase MepM/ murein hydrolase activator NlpD
MSTFSSDRPRIRLGLVIFILLILIVVGLGVGAFMLRSRFESDPPQVTLTPNADVVGTAPFEVRVTDAGSGLKSVTVTLTQGSNTQVLANEQYAQPVKEKTVQVALAKVPGIKEGQATIKVAARDASLWHTFKGNEASVEKNVTLDLTPPTLELIADDRYINFGGVGVLVYRASADTVKTGIKAGDHYYPGFANAIKGHPDYYLALFAHAYDMPPTQRPSIVATDKAGNSREMRVAYELKNVRYKKSTIAVSDNFYQNKVVPLLKDASKRDGSVKDVFVAVDKGVRKENEDKITEVTTKDTPKMLWDGAFAQLSNSKVEANFADARTYTYNGEPIDTAFHLGYDLSVTKHYPVEAANSGIVAFTGDLGLYGNAVIIDHGLGLFTLYGHLSQIDVKVGDAVKKRGIIGRTGETGFAGGDHLHFGVYLDGVAVLPVEWWDQKWIDENITPKLEGHSGEEIATSQQNERIAKKRKRKQR